MIVGIVFGIGFATDAIVESVVSVQEDDAICTVTDSRPEEWEQYLFPDDEVIEVRIYMDESQFEYMSENAIDEVSVPASVVYNGISIKNIAIRPKGNSSLSNAVMEGQDGYSLRMEFDEYIDQDVYGITDINLNNCYGDDTYIRETLAYEIMEEMGLPVPETVFCDVYINDELFGVYLAVQQVDETMLAAWFEDGTGDLYKPEGIGADLSYIDDDYDTYTGMIEKTNVDNDGEEVLVNMIDVLNNGGDLKEVLNVDMILRYLAVNTAIINLDSYVGGMFHNYYLYGIDGKYTIIPWDLNETFMSFGGSGADSIDVTQLLIDEPTNGAVEDYPLVEALLSNAEYLETYHGYLAEIIEGYMQIDNFTERVEELYALIDEHIEADPMASYDTFLNELYETDTQEETAIAQKRRAGKKDKESPALIDFVADRTENIAAQLSGEIASTNGGQGNNTGSVPSLMGDDGSLDVTDNVVENIGGGPPDAELPTDEMLNSGPLDGEMPAGVGPPDGEIPEGEMPVREMPEGEMAAGEMLDSEIPGNAAIMTDENLGLMQEDKLKSILMGGSAVLLILGALVIRRFKRR